MDSLNSDEPIIEYEFYKPQENPDDLFERIAKPKELILEPRPIYLKVGTDSSVKGSAYMEYGNTKVMAEIESPKEITKTTKKSDNATGVIVCCVKYSTFSMCDTNDVKHKENYMNIALKKALEPVVCLQEFSNFQLGIQVLILDDDGCALSTAITCCGAALIDAGIPTFDLVTASTVCLLKGIEFVNPTGDIEDLLYSLPHLSADNNVEEHGILVTSSLASIGQVSQCIHKGYVTSSTLERLCEYSLTINKQMLDTVRHVLMNKVKQRLTETMIEENKTQ